ncbi:MAG: tetratricopeptide repeat protein [Acidobacteria bacterium]|nr:tetratricopeptide repeat protein [Acidobacteriota bacterium]
MNYRIEELRFTLQRDPKSRLFYQLGEMLRREGDLDEAVKVLTAGLEHHPAYVAAWVSLGRALEQGGHHARAADALTTALKIDPENVVAARNLGFALIELEDWRRATEALERAAELVPGDEDLSDALALARSRIEDEAQAAGPEGEAKLPGEPDAAGELPAGPGLGEDVAGEQDADAVPAAEPGPVASVAQPVSRRDVLVARVPDEDPFDVVPRGDTGVWVFEGDVFGMVVTAGTAPQVASQEGLSTLSGEPADGGTPGTAENIPFPTATLARLALEQNDLDLAERTARAVLEQNPGSSLAQEVLAEAGRRRAAATEEPTAVSRAALKIAALRGWLETVTLAREKRVS